MQPANFQEALVYSILQYPSANLQQTARFWTGRIPLFECQIDEPFWKWLEQSRCQRKENSYNCMCESLLVWTTLFRLLALTEVRSTTAPCISQLRVNRHRLLCRNNPATDMHRYDLSGGMAAQLSPMLLGRWVSYVSPPQPDAHRADSLRRTKDCRMTVICFQSLYRELVRRAARCTHACATLEGGGADTDACGCLPACFSLGLP